MKLLITSNVQGSGSLWSCPTNNYSLEEGDEGGHLQFITGVIDRSKVPVFERGLLVISYEKFTHFCLDRDFSDTDGTNGNLKFACMIS